MNLFSKLFYKKKVNDDIPLIPPLAEIVEMMFDKGLSFSDNLQVIKLIYNEEKTKSILINYKNY